MQLIGQTKFKPKAPAIVRAGAYWTPRMMARESEARDPRRRVATSVLDDLMQCRKVITLEPSQARKYRPALKKNGYTIKKSMPIVQAKCDASGVFSRVCVCFFPRELVEIA